MAFWRPLELSASAAVHLPPLMISTTFTSSSYTVHLTDLTRIWSESMSRNDIIKRSRKEATSINPGNGDQFQIFLDKIQVGLAGGKDTTLALTIGAEAERPCLILNVSVGLPGGLTALEWPINLSAAPQASLTSQLTVPLVRAQHDRMQEITSLVNTLKDKDHVIQKLLDKLEGQGMDLDQVFPQAAGKVGRKVDKQRAEERVRGLGVFDMDAWHKGLVHEAVKDMTRLVHDTFSKDQRGHIYTERNPPAPKEQENWWDNIKGITIALDSGKISTSGVVNLNGARRNPKPSKKESDDDDDFQVQATPPHLQTTSKHPARKSIEDDSTDDDEDDDLDAPSQHSKILDSYPVSPPRVVPPSKPKNIRTIWRKKAASKIIPKPIEEDESTVDEDDVPLPTKKTSQKVIHKVTSPSINGEDSMEDKASPPRKATPRKSPNLKAISSPAKGDKSTEDEASSSEAPSPQKKLLPSAPTKPTMKSKRTIGKIGGKKSAPVPEPDHVLEEMPPIRSPSSALETAKTTKPKKGKFTIGGKKQKEPTPAPTEASLQPAASSPVVTPKKTKIGLNEYGHRSEAANPTSVKAEDESQNRGRVPIRQEEVTMEPRETSTERADRRRLELKRELEQKARAPAKKKRKF